MIGHILVFTATFGAWPICLTSQTRAADSVAIVQLVHQHVESMRALRADLQGAIYTHDAVWINAFGRRIVGRDSIVAFLGTLYAEPGYAGSRIVREMDPELFFIRPDVATVHEFHEREGQRLADGSVIARRTQLQRSRVSRMIRGSCEIDSDFSEIPRSLSAIRYNAACPPSGASSE
jgi:hypothetical protein